MADAPAASDVLGLGCVAVDDLLYVARYPPADADEPVLHRARQCGGNTATALVAASRLGARCAFAGVLGDDDASRFVLDALRREGVDVTHHISVPGARPIQSIVIVDQEMTARTIFYDLAGARGADPDRPSADVIAAARVLLVDHFGVEGMTRAARIARTAGIPVVADFESDAGPGFADLLPLVDHLILPRALASRLTGHAEPAAAVNALWAESRQVVAVTGGADGCWYREHGTNAVRHQPAFRVEVVDTTGCGDVFHGAYATALAWGWETAKCLRFAAAAAALKATHPCGQAGCPTRQEVEGFLAERA